MSSTDTTYRTTLSALVGHNVNMQQTAGQLLEIWRRRLDWARENRPGKVLMAEAEVSRLEAMPDVCVALHHLECAGWEVHLHHYATRIQAGNPTLSAARRGDWLVRARSDWYIVTMGMVFNGRKDGMSIAKLSEARDQCLVMIRLSGDPDGVLERLRSDGESVQEAVLTSAGFGAARSAREVERARAAVGAGATEGARAGGGGRGEAVEGAETLRDRQELMRQSVRARVLKKPGV
jgi:hypothetical protein